MILGCIEIRHDTTFAVDPRSTCLVVPRRQNSSARLPSIQSYDMFSFLSLDRSLEMAMFASAVVTEIFFAVSLPSTSLFPHSPSPIKGV